MYGSYGRRSPSPLRNQVSLRRGGARLVGGIIPPPPPPPPPSEPDHDEAFVQETGIKVFTSIPPRPSKRREDVPEDDHASDDDHDDDDEHDDDDDADCYEIIMDDAIIEEDNEDEENDEDKDDEDGEDTDGNDNDDEESTKKDTLPVQLNIRKADENIDSVRSYIHNTKTNLMITGIPNKNIPVADSDHSEMTLNTIKVLSVSDIPKVSDDLLSVSNKSSSGISSDGSSSGVLHAQTDTSHQRDLTPVLIDDKIEVSSIVSNADVDARKPPQTAREALEITSDISRSSSDGSNDSVKLNNTLSSSLKGLNHITHYHAPVSMTVSAHTTPTKEATEYLVRGKPGRLSLPLRDRFVTRPVVLQDNASSADQRPKDGSVLRPIRTIWFRRANKPDGGSAAAAAGGAKAQQQQLQQLVQLQQGTKQKEGGKKDDGWSSSDDSPATLAPTPRQRSGTWSLANSRRRKERIEKEEEARLRLRHKSGDDIHKLATADATLAFTAVGALGAVGVASVRRRGEGGASLGFFDSFRPRSKSDAKAILQARQRRRSGDDNLNSSSLVSAAHETPTPVKEKKKDASPGFFESIRPRSKSDAARLANKKPNIMTTMKNAVQHTLVSPGSGSRGGGGRRSGENTPPLDARMGGAPGEEYHHYTWHAGGERAKTSSLFKVFDIFRTKDNEDRKRRSSSGKGGDRGRRNSGDLHDRSRNSSGSLTSVYIRGMDPAMAASVFRDSRGLPLADPLIDCLNQEKESQILVKFFKLHHSHDLIPTSAKLVIFDTSLQVKKAFYALVHNGVRAAPLWDHAKQKFVGMLTITDFIRILHSFHHNSDPQMDNLEEHRLHMWRTFLKDEDRPLISIAPDDSLYKAIQLLIHHKIHRLPVIDPSTGNVLYIITHKRILKFLYLYINELPKPSVLQQTVEELDIGTYTNIETATPDTLIIEALDKFVKHRISALPIVDAEGKLNDIYAKFDVINLAAEGTYHKLDVTLREANESRNEWFEGVLSCTKDEKLCTVMDRIVRAEVHRLVVVDDTKKVIGVVSLSDILKELVLKPCDDESPVSKCLETSVRDVEEGPQSPEIAPCSTPSPQPPMSPNSVPLTKSGSEESCGDNAELTEGFVSPEAGKVSSSGDSEDEGRYSMDKSEETPPVASPEVLPISG